MRKTVIQELATLVRAYKNCEKRMEANVPGSAAFSTAHVWAERHQEAILDLARNHLPSGAGVDNGVYIDLDECYFGDMPVTRQGKALGREVLAFTFEFHVMEDGQYTGWRYFSLMVEPSFTGLTLHFFVFSGARGPAVEIVENDDLVDHLHEVFVDAFNAKLPQDPLVTLSEASVPRAVSA